MKNSSFVRLINLTPHALVIALPSGEERTMPPSGTVARVKVSQSPAGQADGIPLAQTTYGALEGLPEPEDGTLFVVSALVRAAAGGRSDVASPDTGPDALRTPEGQVRAVRRLLVG